MMYIQICLSTDMSNLRRSITPMIVKVPNLVLMRLISYRSIIELGAFLNFHIFVRISIFPFHTKAFERGSKKTAENVCFQSCILRN